MLTHANLAANVEQIRIHMHDVTPGQERALLLLPLFHVFAMTAGMNYCLAIGAEIVLLPRFDVHEVLRFLTKKRPTLFPGVPSLYAALNAKVGSGRYDLSSVRYCISGGAPLPAEVRQRFEQLSGCKLLEGYGLTEASPVVSANPIDAEPRGSSVGQPCVEHNRRNPLAGKSASHDAGRRKRRSLPARPASDGRLLEQSRRDGGGLCRRRAQNRRHRLSRCRQFSLSRRSHQGHHPLRRVQRLSAHDRRGALSPSGRGGSRRHRRPRSLSRASSHGVSSFCARIRRRRSANCCAFSAISSRSSKFRAASSFATRCRKRRSARSTARCSSKKSGSGGRRRRRNRRFSISARRAFLCASPYINGPRPRLTLARRIDPLRGSAAAPIP